MKKYQLKRIDSTASVTQALTEANFKINYREELNDSQYEAVCAVEGAYLIIAGAGTGKTRTLVYRVSRLVELGYDPSSILLLTFTRKSAAEMLNRAELLLDHRCAKITGGTFHSFANTILRKYAKAAGLEPNFTILDQSDSEDVINLIRTKSKLVQDTKRFPNKATLNKIFSLSVNTGKTIENIVLDEYPHFLTDIDSIITIKNEFALYKERNNLLDYDDLLVKLRDFLFSLSPAAKNLLESINFVMVDEYQDTNNLQSSIVAGLTQLKKNIMAVGDDGQSIYGFRGANFQNILDFQNSFPDAKMIKIEENYRSTQAILNFANAINDAALSGFKKILYTREQFGTMPIILAATNENYQSKFIVDRVLELREEGIPFNKMAVLFRSSYFSFDLEIELTKANIPFVKIGGMKFIETAHVKDLLAFLRIAINPLDLVSWYRVLLLHEGVGPRYAEKVTEELSRNKLNLRESPDNFPDSTIRKKTSELLYLLHEIHTSANTPLEKAQKVFTYYLPIFRNLYDDYHKRSKDLDTLLNIISKYDTIGNLISDLAIEPPVDSVFDLGEEGKEQEDLLTLSTIHSAKGLEWNSVFIIHALDGFFPSNRSMNSAEQLEEERRLMYVAVTRARRNLYISYPMNIFDRENGTTLSKPSRFLNVITSDLAEGYLLDESAFYD